MVALANEVPAVGLLERALSNRQLADQDGAIIFSSMQMRLLSSLVHLIGVSILAYCFARRTSGVDFINLRNNSWARILVALVFADSWLFIFIGGVLISGPGLSYGTIPCGFAIYLCILSYGSSKIFIYWFLVEKVHVVWAPSTGTSRMNSNVYKICMATMSCYLVIVILMLVSRIAEFRDSGECVIGLSPRASIPLIAFDLYLNCFLTGMFVFPLYMSKVINPRLRRVALRTLVAATAALITSAANILILTLMRGRQLGWVCLASCGTDVTFNALALYWVTSSTSEGEPSISPAAPPAHLSSKTNGGSSSNPIRFSRNVNVGLNTMMNGGPDDLNSPDDSESNLKEEIQMQSRTTGKDEHLDVVRSRTGGTGLGTNEYRTSVVAPFELPGSKPGVTFGPSATVTAGAAQDRGRRGSKDDDKPEHKRTKSPFQILKKIGNTVMMNKQDYDDDAHQFSVQVTVTREFEQTQELEASRGGHMRTYSNTTSSDGMREGSFKKSALADDRSSQ